MPDNWATQFTQHALTRVDAFIAAHPECTLQRVTQPGQGATNRVVFARRNGQLSAATSLMTACLEREMIGPARRIRAAIAGPSSP